MSKRLTDTDKWGKLFFRGIKGPYKLLFQYLCDRCDHAGIWHVNFEVAQIEIGKDMKINESTALTLFGNKIIPFDNGEKWFIPGFLEIQYGELQEKNRAHLSVINRLKKYGFWDEATNSVFLHKDLCMPLTSPLQGDKDKDKDKEQDKEIKGGVGGFEKFWEAYPKKVDIAHAEKAWRKIKPTIDLQFKIISAVEKAKSTVWANKDKEFIPHPATWLNGKRWLDEVYVKTSDDQSLKIIQETIRGAI